MQKVECSQIEEKLYTEELENGLKVLIIPKKNTRKKYVIWGTHFGSIDNKFVSPETGEIISVPDGVAHFLEHKMFEQENGRDSLYEMMALGIDANAYTSNNHTAFLFECSDHFYEGLDILMDYVQHPYFTEQNVEKEKGIIGQEIMMYEDDPGWQLFMNAMDCLYKENPIKIDIAGSIESISQITPEILYKCYNTFYHPSNMILVVCGNFEPEKILKEIKNRLVKNVKQQEIKRIYPSSETKINKAYAEKHMPISMPIFMIGYKDKILEDKKEAIKRQIAVEMLLNLLIGESSNLYTELYNKGKVFGPLDFDYEFSSQYAHALLSGQAINPEEICKKFQDEIDKMCKNGINMQDFIRIKKKIYGEYVMEYNEVSSTAKMFLSDYINGINSFDYIEEFKNIKKEYLEKILKEIFKKENSVLSVVKQ